jgi:hypothetical protein
MLGRETFKALSLLAAMLATLLLVVLVYPGLARNYALVLVALGTLAAWLAAVAWRVSRLPYDE